MTEAVALRGYRSTSVADVLGRAGVSRTAFYERYASKEGCFADAIDEIVATALAAVDRATPRIGSAEERLAAPIAALLETIAAHPQAARAALIETHAAGSGAAARRVAAHDLLVAHVARVLAGRGARGRLAETVPPAVGGGIEVLLVRAVREERTAGLPELAAPIARWAAAHAPLLAPGAPPLPDPATRAPSRRRGQAPGSLVPTGPSGRRGLPPGPKRVPRDAVAATIRDRLLDATVEVAAGDGIDGLTVAAIVARAETSRRSFYEHFSSISEALEAALQLGGEAAAASTLTAYAARRDPVAGVVAGVDRLAGFLAEEPAFATAALLEAPAAGVEALAARDAALDAFAGILADAHRRIGAVGPHVDLAADLSAGAVLSACARELGAERPPNLLERAPELAAIALAPVASPTASAAAIGEVLGLG